MAYKNADSILPESLIKEIQKYVQGEQIYIPRQEGKKLGWGMKNGTRDMIAKRNQDIRALKAEGTTLNDLADNFALSIDSVKKIVYAPNN